MNTLAPSSLRIALLALAFASVSQAADKKLIDTSVRTSIAESRPMPGNGSPLKIDAKRQLQTDVAFIQQSESMSLRWRSATDLASRRSTTPAVREFASASLTEQEQLQTGLMALAQKKKISLSGKVAAQDKAAIGELDKLKGEDFDRAYLGQMTRQYQEVASFYRQRAEITRDHDLHGFIGENLPALQQRAKLAEAQYQSLLKS